MKAAARVLPAGSVSKGAARWALFGITEIPDHDDPSRVYLKRWRIVESPYFGVKVHHIRMSDNPTTRGLHDHPWSFISIRLRGGYHELRPGPNFDRYSGPWMLVIGEKRGIYRRHTHRRVNVVRSTDLHAVCLTDDKPCWTLVFNGPRRREWGFRFPGAEWLPWQQLPGAHARNVRGKAGSTMETKP